MSLPLVENLGEIGNPAEVAAWFLDLPYLVLLDSGTSTIAGGEAHQLARFSFLTADPVLVVRSKGTLTVATDATYAPMEFFASNGKTIVGVDADLAKALGTVLGLNFKVVNGTFATIIPGLASGKYGVGMSSFTDTKARQKKVDFVTYFVAGTSFYVKASGGPAISSLKSLCGHTVAVEKGTTQQADATAQGKKCKVHVAAYPDQNGVNLALSSGRAQVAMADSPVAAYISA